MSDDTPTERYPDGFSPAEPVSAPADDEPDPRTRTLITVLAIVGSVLLLIVIGLLLWIALRGSGEATPPVATDTETSASPTPTVSDTPSATPSATPSPTPTETLPPPPPEHAIGAFLADPTTVNCSGVSSVTVTFVWVASGTKAWFGVGTTDASLQPYEEVALEAEYPFEYQCGQATKQQIYTLTVLTDDGEKEHASVTIREN